MPLPTLVELLDLLRLDAARVKRDAHASMPGIRRATDRAPGVDAGIADRMAIPNAVLFPGFEHGVR